MDLLCLDACSAISIAARVRDGKILHHVVGKQPSSLLPEAFLDLTREGPPPAGIAVSRGPGSFTGIKVGLAGAWGFARARGLPMSGVDRLEALALAASRAGGPPDRLYTATVPAWAGMVYAAVFGVREGRVLRQGSYLLGLPAVVLAGLPEGTVRVDPADPTPWEKFPGATDAFSGQLRIEPEALALAIAELGAARILGSAGGTGQVRPLFLRMTEEKSW